MPTVTLEHESQAVLNMGSDVKPQTQSVEEFKETLYKMQNSRRQITYSVLNDKNIEEELTKVIEDTLSEMRDSRTENKKRKIATKGSTFSINIQDEIRGLNKDVQFLSRLQQSETGRIEDKLKTIKLDEILASFHESGAEEFLREVDECEQFLQEVTDKSTTNGVKPLFVTDWDGTMKDYCSQYATNVQPIYSAVVLGTFASLFTRMSAVLTAGPLRGPGILDLTSLPINGPVLFSGSWGREWWLNGRRVVHDDGVPEEGIVAIGQLYEQLEDLFREGEFVQFALVGSGVQRKVDRLTLGTQTVFGDVPPELSARYINAVRERVHRVDPSNQYLVLENCSPLEIEVCVHSSGAVWNKGDGVSSLFESIGDSLSIGKVLVAGDTSSDIPMLKKAAEENPEGVRALFVGCNEELRNYVLRTVPNGTQACFISSPDVAHAAFARLIATLITD